MPYGIHTVDPDSLGGFKIKKIYYRALKFA